MSHSLIAARAPRTALVAATVALGFAGAQAPDAQAYSASYYKSKVLALKQDNRETQKTIAELRRDLAAAKRQAEGARDDAQGARGDARRSDAALGRVLGSLGGEGTPERRLAAIRAVLGGDGAILTRAGHLRAERDQFAAAHGTVARERDAVTGQRDALRQDVAGAIELLGGEGELLGRVKALAAKVAVDEAAPTIAARVDHLLAGGAELHGLGEAIGGTGTLAERVAAVGAALGGEGSLKKRALELQSLAGGEGTVAHRITSIQHTLVDVTTARDVALDDKAALEASLAEARAAVTDAEAARDEALAGKTEAEAALAAAQQAKAEAEAARDQALADKAAAETALAAAEQAKADAEAARDQALADKATAETARDAAIQDKQELEQSIVTASEILGGQASEPLHLRLDYVRTILGGADGATVLAQIGADSDAPTSDPTASLFAQVRWLFDTTVGDPTQWNQGMTLEDGVQTISHSVSGP